MRYWAAILSILLVGCASEEPEFLHAPDQPASTLPTTLSWKITSFQGQYRFLSNAWPVDVEMEGIVYPTVEHAYQAAKTADVKQRRRIAAMLTPEQAQEAGRALPLPDGWDKTKFVVMEQLVRQKFVRYRDLAELLLETGDAYLENNNNTTDTVWGVFDGVGENRLGKILMTVRDELRAAPLPAVPSAR